MKSSGDLTTQISDMNEQLFNLNSQYQELSQGGIVDALYTNPVPSEMISLSLQRKELMLQLIEQDPKSFIELSIPDETRATMPEQVIENIEFSTEKQGDLEVLHYDDFVNNQSWEEYYLNEHGEKSSLHFADGEPYGLVSGTKVRLSGLQLDDKIALYKKPTDEWHTLEVLSVPDNSDSLGEQKTIVILISFLDDGDPVRTQEEVNQIVFDNPQEPRQEVNNFYKEISYGGIWLSGDVIGWISIPEITNNCDPYVIVDKAIEYADPYVYFPDYKRIIIIHPRQHCSYSGVAFTVQKENDGGFYASVALLKEGLGSGYIYTDATLTTIISHELGHNFGAGHSGSYECNEEILNIDASNCETNYYGDVYDIMGKGWFDLSLHFTGVNKENSGWLNEDNKINVTQSGKYIIYPLEFDSTNKKFIEILLSNEIPYTPYYSFPAVISGYNLEFRIPFGFDGNIAKFQDYRGLIIRALVRPTEEYRKRGYTYSFTSLLDTTPNSRSNDFADSILTLGNTFYDPYNKISITPTRLTEDGGIEVQIIIINPECSDGEDNDGDGKIDSGYDSGCKGKDDVSEKEECQDEIDNDEDETCDYGGCIVGGVSLEKDRDCTKAIDNKETKDITQCDDGIDNDDDGAIDLNDFSCQNDVYNIMETYPKTQCQDGKDNDNDGVMDMYDEDCSDEQDNNESGTVPIYICSDGLDNDGDGAIDYGSDLYGDDKNDNGCSGYQDESEEFDCNDGIDNNNNGFCDWNGCIIEGETISAEPGCCNEPNSNRESPNYDGPSTCGISPSYCGDGICISNDGEDCNTCVIDCGECEPYGYGKLLPSPEIAEESIWARLWSWIRGLFQ